MTNNYKLYRSTLTSLALAATSAYAAEITWQTSVIMSDETNVSLNGQVRLAINAVNDTVTVNGVEFTQVANTALLGTAPSLNGGFESMASDITGAANVFNSGDTTAPLSSMLPGAFWGGTAPVATTFSNLVPGQEYEVQIFCNGRNSRNDQYVTMFDNGLDPSDLNYVEIAGTAKLNNIDRTVEPNEGVGQGDYILGTFTADGTVQTFRQLGSTNGGVSGNSTGRIHINAIQLRAIGTILPIPEPSEAFWTGLVDANLDNVTTNFALNAPEAPLSQGSLADAAVSGANVVFADDYTSDPGGTVDVSQSSLLIPVDAAPTAPQLTFRNSNETPYTITSGDTTGITGDSTGLITNDPDSETEGNGGTLNLLGTHTFGGDLVASPDTTINIGDATTAASLPNAALINNGVVNFDTTPGDASFNGSIAGAGTLGKNGPGTLTFSGDTAGFSTGTTNLSSGNIVATGMFRDSTINIASATIFEYQDAGGFDTAAEYYGSGTLRFSEPGGSSNGIRFRSIIDLNSDGLIEVASGALRGSGGDAANWTSNESDMNIATGATFNGVEARVRVNALNGGGDITTGWVSLGYPARGFTIGVADGSGTFDGSLSDTNTLDAHFGIIRKVGTGTQTFGGALTHSGNTIAQNGILELSSTGSHTFFLGAGPSISGDGGTNRITGETSPNADPPETGTGIVSIDGQFIFDDTNAAIPLAEGDFWVIVDSRELATVTYGDNFNPAMLDFPLVETPLGSGIWQSETENNPLEGVPWTFLESTGTLSLGEPVLPDFNAWANSFLPDDVSDPDGDFDNDGKTNEEEYQFALDPTDGSSNDPITVPLDTATGTLSFTRRDPALTGDLTSIETSTGLTMWMRDTGAVLTPGPVVDDVQTVAVQISPSLLTAPRLFVRIMQGEIILFSTDFEDGDGGFTAFGSPNDWAYGMPNSDNGLTPPDQLVVTSGNGGSANCWGTVLTGGEPSGAITAAANSILQGPDAAGAGIDLNGISTAELSFAAAMDIAGADTLEVLVKQVGSGNTLVTISGLELTPPKTTDWAILGPYDISAAADNNVYLEFRFVGTENTYIGLYIDDITVRETP